MKNNFRIQSRRGIFFSFALLFCCAPVAQVSAFQSGSEAVESEKPASEKPATTEQAPVEPKESTSDETESDDNTAKSISEQIEELTAEYQLDMFVWREKYKAAKTRGAKMKLTKISPAIAYSAKLRKFYEANPDDKDAMNAFREAVIAMGPQTKPRDSETLLEIATKQEPEDAKKSYLALARFGSPATKGAAFQKVFAFAKQEPDDATAIEMLNLVAAGSAGYGALVSTEEIWNRVKSKPEEADFETLAMIAMKARPEVSGPAYIALMENYDDHRDFQKALTRVPRELNSGFERVVKNVMKEGQGDLQVQAAISLAWYAEIRHFCIDAKRLPDDKLAILEKEKQDLIEFFRSVDEDSELYKAAQRELFLLENLAPGDEAPDITGLDIDGNQLKLSDFRGKVVMLSFWGDWCPPCRALFPHERSLSRALADKPFTIIGVNSDQKPNISENVCELKDITWPNFTDFQAGGRISVDWRVRAWPTVYLIDKDGIIREKGPLYITNPAQRGKILDRAIEEMLTEMDVEVDLQRINHEAADKKAMEAHRAKRKAAGFEEPHAIPGHSHSHSHDH